MPGWRFRIITEQEVRTPKLENARFLLRYRNAIPDADLMQAVDAGHKNAGNDPCRLDAGNSPGQWNQARLIPVLWYMVATFRLEST